ncbi:MAG: hypothetical protein KF887_06015 [Paracoccaceae bacterium]|nr:MAG: hypothetical protein KF887_06015 [Paracoccaceae bacterium]
MAGNVKIERIQEAEAAITALSGEESRMRQIYLQDGVIDATEQDALDRTKAKIDKLRGVVAQLRAEIEENKRIWESHGAEWADLQAKVQALRDFDHRDLGTFADSETAINLATADQRWPDATAELQQAMANIGPTWADYEAQIAARAAYEPLRADLTGRLTTADGATPQNGTITGRLSSIRGNLGAMDAEAAARNYVGALDLLRIGVAELTTAETEIEALRVAEAAYQTALTALAPRIQAVSTSLPIGAEALQHEIIDAESAMTAAAGASEFVQAMEKAAELERALTAYETVVENFELYQSRLAAIQTELAEALVSDPRWTYLEPIQSEMAGIQTEMEAAAAAHDYARAVVLIADLEAKLAEFHAAIAAKKAEYDAARGAFDHLISHVEPCTYPLEPQKTAVRTILKDMEKAASAEDWDAAVNGIGGLEKALADFQAAHDAHDATLRAKITPELPAMRTAADDKGNGELSSAKMLKNDIAALDKALAGKDDLTEAVEIMERARKLATDLEKIRKIRDRLDKMFGSDTEAVKIVDELKNDNTLKDLPIEARNMLIEKLTKNGLLNSIAPDEQKAVQEIWQSTAKLDPAYEAMDKKTTDGIVKKLRDDPKIKKYAAEWATMDPAAKQAAMKDVGAIIGGPDGWNVEGSEKINFTAQQGLCLTDSTLRGYHSPASATKAEEIGVCVGNPSGEWNPQSDFTDVVQNLVHEVGHGYQESLIEKYESGKLKPGSPEYEQARSLSFDRKYFKQFPGDYNVWDVYVHSPMEQQSRHTANRVRKDLPPEYGGGYTQELN